MPASGFCLGQATPPLPSIDGKRPLRTSDEHRSHTFGTVPSRPPPRTWETYYEGYESLTTDDIVAWSSSRSTRRGT